VQGIGVLRLIRVAIGDLALAELGKGQWRHLSADEVMRLAGTDDDAVAAKSVRVGAPSAKSAPPRDGSARGPARRK
jgi:hypothetical protein